MAGGRTTNEDGSEGVKLDSTELFIGGKWLTVGPLPVAVTGVRGVTLDDKVLMAGSIFPIYVLPILLIIIAGGSGSRGSGKRNDIWIYDDATESWSTSPVSMQERRSWHGASVVTFYHYFYDYCL